MGTRLPIQLWESPVRALLDRGTGAGQMALVIAFVSQREYRSRGHSPACTATSTTPYATNRS
jgi:hypothetical protein